VPPEPTRFRPCARSFRARLATGAGSYRGQSEESSQQTRVGHRDSEALKLSQIRDMLGAIRKMEEKWMAWREFDPDDPVLRSLADCRVRLEHALKRLEE